jgi:hypothetical protein
LITWWDLIESFWLTGFLLLVSLLIFALAYGAVRGLRKSSNTTARGQKLILAGFLGGLPLGFIGIVAGFLTGSSRSPAIAALVPAILTFLGLIMVYLIGKGRLRAIIAGFAVSVFSADLLVGTVLGSASRDRHEEFLASVRFQKLKADQEFAIRRYRGALGLPLDAPKPSSPVVSPEKP